MVNVEQLLNAEAINPVLPAEANAIWIALAVVIIGVVVAALVTIWASKTVGGGAKVSWTVAVFVLPFIGSVAWFIVRGMSSRPRSTASNSA